MAAKNKIEEKERVCLLLDRDSKLLARGEIESEVGDPNVIVYVSGGDTDEVANAEIVQIIPSDRNDPSIIGQVIFRRGNRVTFEPIRKAGEVLRQNFRMQVDFSSFVYPKEGGRAPVRALDLSCGGIAMYSAAHFEVGKIYEVVIPITSEGPLILDCEILRTAPYSGPILLYAAKFIDLVDDQETMLREAVFQAQLESIKLRKKQSQSKAKPKGSRR